MTLEIDISDTGRAPKLICNVLSPSINSVGMSNDLSSLNRAAAYIPESHRAKLASANTT